MVDYQAKFERMLSKVGSLTQDQKVSCFVTGLKDSICTNVQANRPTTLTMAIGLARLFEARDLAQKKTSTQTTRPTFQERNQSMSATVKRMTPDELSERRKKGLCFHCNDKYSPGHNYKKLFMVEASWDGDDDDVEMEVDEENHKASPKISLHAIAGFQAPKTMRIWGSLMGHSVVALVDSGSTHNFISSQATQLAKLQPNAKGKLEVMVALGEKLVSPGRCSQVSIKLQKVPFFVDLFILPLEGYDVVLGTQWLRMLGPIQWDFEKLQMKFIWDRKEVVL